MALSSIECVYCQQFILRIKGEKNMSQERQEQQPKVQVRRDDEGGAEVEITSGSFTLGGPNEEDNAPRVLIETSLQLDESGEEEDDEEVLFEITVDMHGIHVEKAPEGLLENPEFAVQMAESRDIMEKLYAEVSAIESSPAFVISKTIQHMDWTIRWYQANAKLVDSEYLSTLVANYEELKKLLSSSGHEITAFTDEDNTVETYGSFAEALPMLFERIDMDESYLNMCVKLQALNQKQAYDLQMKPIKHGFCISTSTWLAKSPAIAAIDLSGDSDEEVAQKLVNALDYATETLQESTIDFFASDKLGQYISNIYTVIRDMIVEPDVDAESLDYEKFGEFESAFIETYKALVKVVALLPDAIKRHIVQADTDLIVYRAMNYLLTMLPMVSGDNTLLLQQKRLAQEEQTGSAYAKDSDESKDE